MSMAAWRQSVKHRKKDLGYKLRNRWQLFRFFRGMWVYPKHHRWLFRLEFWGQHFCKYQGVFYHENWTRCHNCSVAWDEMKSQTDHLLWCYVRHDKHCLNIEVTQEEDWYFGWKLIQFILFEFFKNCWSVRIKRALRYKVKDTCFIDQKAKGLIFVATKPNSHLSYSRRNLFKQSSGNFFTALELL